MKYYAINLKPYSNGTTRWSLYRLVNGQLERFWPADTSDAIKAKKNGWSVASMGTKWPRFHISLKGIGTSHTYLLKEAISYILEHEQGLLIDANKIDLEVLS